MGFVRARIDDQLKEEASAVLAGIGLTVSDAVRMTLTRIAKDKRLPESLVVPNAETLQAIKEGEALRLQGKARFSSVREMLDDIEKED